MNPVACRPFDFRLALGLPLLVMALLLVFEPHRLDFAISHYSFWLESILHTRIKQLLIVFSFAVLTAFVLSWILPSMKSWRRWLGYLVLALALCSSVVTPLKKLSNQHCPWSLQEFGGQQGFRSLFAPKVEGNKPGVCWPAGHASAGFGWLALFFFLRDRYPKSARAALAFALLLGNLLAFGRLIQGAHFLSHGIWTMLIDWTICAALYRLLLYRRPKQDGSDGDTLKTAPDEPLQAT